MLNNLVIHKILWLVIIFTPTFYHLVGTHKGQLLYTIIVVIIEVFLLLISKLDISKIVIRPIVIAFSFSMYFSIVILFNNQNLLASSDLFDIFRPILYLLFFLFPLIVRINIEDFKKLFKFIVNLILLSALLDFVSFIKPLEFIIGLYRPAHYGEFNYFRFSGMFGYAYNYAFVLIFFIIYYLRISEKIIYKNYFILFSLVLFLVLTGSRTSILSLFIIVFLFYILKKKNILMILLKIIKLILFIGIIILVFNYLEFDFFEKIFNYIYRLILFAQGESNDGAASTRISQLSGGLSYLTTNNLLLGIGPSKNILPIMESMYPNYLVKWGLIGIFMYFSMLSSMYYIAKTNKEFINNIMISYRGLIIVIFIFGFSTSPTDQVKLYNFFYILSGYIYFFKFCTKQRNIINE